MNAVSSFAVAVLAIVASAVLLGLHDITADQFLAVLVGAGIHVSSVTIPAITSSSSSSGPPA